MISISEAAYCIKTLYPNVRYIASADGDYYFAVRCYNDDDSYFEIMNCRVNWSHSKDQKIDVNQQLADQIRELKKQLKACDSLVVETIKDGR
jgi:hypothetical protein